MRFFTICTVVGFGVLAPLNFTDTYLADNPSEQAEHQYGTLEKLTILNISYGSIRYHASQNPVLIPFTSFTGKP